MREAECLALKILRDEGMEAAAGYIIEQSMIVLTEGEVLPL